MDPRQAWELTAPADDGQVLLWPAPAFWAQAAEQTAERLDGEGSCRLLGMPLGRARALARINASFWAGKEWAGRRPWIATGHQTFPYHPGIWAKNVAVDAASRTAGGAAVNLNVDHDLPHPGFQLTWPALDEGGRIVRRGALPLDKGRPFERQPTPAAAEIDRACADISRDLGRLLTEPLACPFRPPGNEGTAAGGGAPCENGDWRRGASFGRWFAATRAVLDRRLGLQVCETMVSRLAEADAFLLLLADAVSRAGEFHAAYNDAIAEAARITGHAPAPLLQRGTGGDPGQIELPFWTLRAQSGGRGRLFVRPAGGGFLFCDETGPFGELSGGSLAQGEPAVAALRKTLNDAGVCLRPRALTLTLFARMLLVDLFVHGVGGARYDVATDRLIERFYRVPPPPFAAASATVFLPLNAITATAEQLRRARHGLRDFRFNPQRHLSAELLGSRSATEALSARNAGISANQVLRESADRRWPETRARRAELFNCIRHANGQLAALDETEFRRRESLVRQLSEQRRAAAVVQARDYFYGLYPPARLETLRDRIRQQFS